MMKKLNLRKKLMISYMFILVVVITLTWIGFDTLTKVYITSSAWKSIESSRQYIDAESMGVMFRYHDKDEQRNPYTENQLLQEIMNISSQMSMASSIFDIQYLVVSNDNTMLYPIVDSAEDEKYIFINENIWPNIAENDMGRFVFSGADKTRYLAFKDKVTDSSGNVLGFVIVYAGMAGTEQFTSTITYITVMIFLMASIIAVLISVVIATRIANPILELRDYANEIGRRNFKAEPPEKTDDEIGELAEEMSNMAYRLDKHDKELKTFFQNASHELRTPLMSIQGYAEGIKLGVFDNNEEAAQIIEQESKRLTGIVDGLMYISRLETVEDIYEKAPFSLTDLVNESMSITKGEAMAKNITLKANLPEKPITLTGDIEKLSAALVNVISNCIRFAKTEVSLTVIKTSEATVIYIADDGTGINENDLPHIFERFYKGKSGKTGLGLAITKTIIEAHGGTVCAKNTQNGALFEIALKN